MRLSNNKRVIALAFYHCEAWQQQRAITLAFYHCEAWQQQSGHCSCLLPLFGLATTERLLLLPSTTVRLVNNKTAIALAFYHCEAWQQQDNHCSCPLPIKQFTKNKCRTLSIFTQDDLKQIVKEVTTYIHIYCIYKHLGNLNILWNVQACGIAVNIFHLVNKWQFSNYLWDIHGSPRVKTRLRCNHLHIRH